MKPKVALLNDTSLQNTHFGCQLVGQTFREQFARTGLDLVCSLPLRFDAGRMASRLREIDLVVVNGEGSIHHGKNLHLLDVATSFPAVLVNCVFEKNPTHPGIDRFLYVSTRESRSCREVIRFRSQCDVVPEVIFASACLLSYTPLIDPLEDVGVTDNVTSPEAGFSPKSPKVSDYLETLCKYRRLCVGRFHAAVAASVLRIPFSTWESNTWKTRSLMHDMGLSHLHFATQEEALKHIPNVFPEEAGRFAGKARSRIEAMFNAIAELARKSSRDRKKSRYNPRSICERFFSGRLFPLSRTNVFWDRNEGIE